VRAELRRKPAPPHPQARDLGSDFCIQVQTRNWREQARLLSFLGLGKPATQGKSCKPLKINRLRPWCQACSRPSRRRRPPP